MQTLFGLLRDLQGLDPSLPLVFVTEAGDISPGYHVTELRHVSAKGIDCAGQIDTWTEAILQLLDGQGHTHMSLGKFRSIVSRSLAAMPELESAALRVEFGHDNTELRLMSLHPPKRLGDRVIIRLAHTRAVCKPGERMPFKGLRANPRCRPDAKPAVTTSGCVEVDSCCGVKTHTGIESP